MIDLVPFVVLVPLCGSCTFEIKMCLRWLTVVRQCALWADGVWTLENPVLPRGQAAVDLCIHRLWSSETERCFHSRQRVGRQGRAFFDGDAYLVFPVEIVGGKSYQTKLVRLFCIERLLLAEDIVD